MKKYIIVLLMATACHDEIGPCFESEQYCRELLRQMNEAKDPKEKEQIRQFYLAEKNLLEGCYKVNGK